jgi:hypothetical protein
MDRLRSDLSLRHQFAPRRNPGRSSLVLVAVSVCVAVVARPAHAEGVFLTPQENDRVMAIALADTRVREALGDATVHVEDVLPWSDDGTRATLIGGEVTLALDQPGTLEADWPLMDWSPQTGYTFTTVHFRADGVDALTVDVDLRSKKVVAFDVRDGVVDERTVREVGGAATPPEGERTTASRGGLPPALLAGLAGLCAALAAIGVLASRRHRRNRVVGELPGGS